ncbi:response regulator [Salinarimonas soli]|uniref:Response regulator n=1 Tax=Salinarimonas soli TaxID=1638099 RepID=A0A5B2VC50_9HYPH|nr:response regulator [Salinarimonas soli]KAA2235992.1 response regulator [Salinarimonas soli]
MHGAASLMTRSLRVLVVEDEALVADYVADIIEDAGHTVAGVAATGEKAIELLESASIDLAVLDITLRGPMTGIDVASTARACGVPHLFITGSGDPSTRAAAEETQPLGFLLKPFSGERLIEVLMAVITSGHEPL